MPIYRYRPDPSPCKLCGTGFEQTERTGAPPLRECPTCGKPVVRELPAGFATPKVTRKPSVSDAKQAGFTVLKKIGRGEYEKQ